MAAAPPGLAAAGMLVDEETPEARLDRLDKEMLGMMPGSPAYLELAAETGTLRWRQANLALLAAKTEQKQAVEEGDDDEKAAAAEKVELAQAEAELAGAKAELAQAKADGDKETAKALAVQVASFNDTVTELKKQEAAGKALFGKKHRRGGGGDLPAAKRLRLLVKPQHEPVAPKSELIGRGEAVEEVRRVALENFNGRGNIDHARHHFLTFNGHVRTGKTRMGEETPRIINELAVESGDLRWRPAAYLPIRFQNGSQFAEQLDASPDSDMLTKLTARVAAAVGDLLDEGDHKVKLGKMSLEGAKSLDLAIIIKMLVDHHLRDAPAGAVLPIVIHFDEYGRYVEAANKAAGRDVSDVFVNMLCHVGSLMAHSDDLRFFVVPVVTGTSYNDVSLGRVSNYPLSRPPLRLLTTGESVALARSFWACKNEELRRRPDEPQHGPCPIGESGAIPRTLGAQLFAAALADAGGYPGFIDMLCQERSDQRGIYAEKLHRAVTVYSDKLAHKPPTDLWAQIVRKMLTREVLHPTSKIAYNDGGQIQDVPVHSLIDRGYVMANWLPGSVPGEPPTRLRLSVPASMLRHWIDDRTDVFDTSVIGNDCRARPAHWESFEWFHAHFVAARIAALHHQPLQGGAVPTVGDVLAGARPLGAGILGREVSPPMDRARVVDDAHHIIFTKKSGGFKKSKVPEVFDDGVHLCKANNPVVDAYVDVGGAYIFFQYKHRGLMSSTTYSTRDVLKGARQLRMALETASKTWKRLYASGLVVFVWVTNAPVIVNEDIPADAGVLYVGADELEVHVGAEFAGRGLLPHDLLDEAASDGSRT